MYNNKKTICFYAGYTQPFNGLNYKDKYVNGSEINLISLSEKLSKYYNIYILIWNLKKDNDEIYYNNVNYIDCDNFNIIKDKIDIMIISRYLNFFIHFEHLNIKTLFWIQDLHPHHSYNNSLLDNDGKYFLKNIDNKIHNYISLSTFHKNFLVKNNYIDSDKIKIIGNGLNKEEPLQFNKINTKRIPKRFLFCSDPCRGLTYFIDFIIELQKTDDDISVCVFRSNDFDEHQKNNIKNIKKLTLHNNANQKILFNEFMKSQFLLYTCCFQETYCNIALEAQYHGCVCIYNNLGALTETINNRGLLLDGHPKDKDFINNNINNIITLLNNKNMIIEYQKRGLEYSNNQYYSTIANEWINIINN